jgi:putative transposase
VLMFRIRRGIRFNANDGRLWTIDRILISSRIVLFAEDGYVETLSKRELIRRWHQHELLIDTSSIRDTTDTLFTATDRDLSAFSPNQRAQAESRFAAISPLCGLRVVSTAALEARRQELAQSGSSIVPSVRTLWRWLIRYRAGQDITSLIDVQPTRRSRDCEELQSLYEKAISETYLTRERAKVSRVFDHFEKLLDQYNRSCPTEAKLKGLSRATFYRRMECIEAADADRQRLGRFEANKVHRTALAHARAQCNLDRVELDHTQLDIILIDERSGQALGRPWLTVAICVYSKMVVGLYLTFEPPSSHSVLQCLKFAILPKDELLREFPDTQNDWPVYGVPTTIVFDNSLDAHGGRVRQFCLSVGASIQYCPSRKPWFKGAVERYMRTQNQGVLHELPGTTFSNPKQRAGYQSELMCRIGKKQFSHLLLRWVADVYHITPHRTTRMPPLERWKENSAARNFDLPASPADLDLLVARPATRRLHHYGVEIEGLRYNSGALQDIYRQLEGRRRAPRNHALVDVRHHDETVAHIDVLDPTSNRFIRVPAVDQEYAKGRDRHTHLIITRNLRRKYGPNWRIHDRRKAMADIQAIVDEAGQNKRRLTRRANRAERDHRILTQIPTPKPTSARPTLIAFSGRQRPEADLPELTPLEVSYAGSTTRAKR